MLRGINLPVPAIYMFLWIVLNSEGIVCISDVNTIVFVLSPKARSALYVILNYRYSYAQCSHVSTFAGSIANVSSNQDIKAAVKVAARSGSLQSAWGFKKQFVFMRFYDQFETLLRSRFTPSLSNGCLHKILRLQDRTFGSTIARFQQTSIVTIYSL